MTAPLFLRSFGGGDDAERVRHFHRRLSQDTVARAVPPAHSTNETIGGVLVSELLARVRAGDSTALTTLYDALFEPLWRVAVLQTNSADAADDLVHDVFLRLWMHRQTLDAVADIRVYLSAAVRNRARDLGKHRQVIDTTTQTRASTEIAGLGQPEPATDASAETQEFLVAYRDALTLLTEPERTAALLRWEERFTLEQIAGVLSMSVMGARGVVLRAQQKVQGALRKFR